MNNDSIFRARGGVPLVEPSVGVFDGVVLVEAAGLRHGGDLFLCGRRRLKKTVLRGPG